MRVGVDAGSVGGWAWGLYKYEAGEGAYVFYIFRVYVFGQ